MHIGKLILERPVIMAPMAGITDYPFRQILRKMGCQLLYTEMISSKGLVYNNKKTNDLIDYSTDAPGLIGVQLFGEEPSIMAEAASIVESKYQPDLIDINMGCPTPKIVKNGAGVALMRKPELAGKLINLMVKAVDIPVTVKIRKGWDDTEVNAVEIAEIAEEMGASAITIHGRTRAQFYSGNADWEIIRRLKENISIPIIGNGDVFTPELAKRMINITNCNGVMVARGARGNPWLIKRANHFVTTGNLLPKPDYEEIITLAVDHLQKSVNYYGEQRAIPLMRKHISWYVKGLPYSTDIKNKVNRLTCATRIKKILNNYLNKLIDEDIDQI